ncbi:BMP family ABC transporter substrate-binding protein [Salibacterium aidingense]|uniref:BMP family ABC transporter substrate-binding protein n=1 Tax=Salibacterium aidingense TaxID=384933 RepID=UPI003BBED209
MAHVFAGFKVWGVCSTIIMMTLVTGCDNPVSTASSEEKAALLLENTIDEQGWNSKGYQGLLNIQSELGMEVTYEENVADMRKLKETVQGMQENGVTLLFGHGKTFADMFMKIKDDYPDLHFVSLNGAAEGDNITAVQFEGYAMGYFAGRLSSEMTQTNTIGVIAAQEWQPETEGFIEGAENNKESINVLKDSVGGWNDEDKALQILESMTSQEADIIYPAGNGFHVEVINELKSQGLQAIGYIGDQSDLGETTVLTSTVQHVDKMYQNIARQYQSGELKNGTISYGFKEGAISLGSFSPAVPDDVKDELEREIDHYKDTGELPGQ